MALLALTHGHARAVPEGLGHLGFLVFVVAAGAEGAAELVFMTCQALEHHRRDAGIAAEIGAGALGVGLRELANHLKAVAGLGGRSIRHEGKGEAERIACAGLASGYETNRFRKSTLKHTGSTRG